MRLLFLTDNFPPEVNAPATRTYEHCREWAKSGIDVTVITCVPNFPQGKVYPGYRNKFWQREVMDGIKVIRVWSYIAPNAGFSKRIIDYLSYAFMAFGASLFVKTDIIVATSPQFFTAVAGRWSAFFKRRPWVMEVRDLWPESIRAVGMAKGRERWLDRLEKLELSLYRNANRVIVVTNSFKNNISSRGISNKKIEVITNGVVIDRFNPRPKNNELLVKLNLAGKFIISYIGTHGLAHKLDFILHCARKVPEQVHFLLIGDGAEKRNLEALHKKMTLPNVSMLPAVPKAEITSYLSITDVALVNLKKSDTFKKVIPSKIFEAAAMGKPILLGVEGESKEIIEQYAAGLCYEPEHEESFLQALQKLYTDNDLYHKCSQNAIKMADQYDRTKKAKHLMEILKCVNPLA